MKILEGRPSSYDRLMDRASRGKVRSIKEDVASEVSAGSRVLEIGCGTGELAEMLVQRGATVEGFDLNPAMIEQARKRIQGRGLEGRFSVHHMGVEEMDRLPATSFDIVVCTLALSELNPDELRFALQHSRRILRPGGRIVIADEVVPTNALRRFLHALVRAPLALLGYLVARGTSRPLRDIGGDLARAGFVVEKDVRSHGDAFALVVARRTE